MDEAPSIAVVFVNVFLAIIGTFGNFLIIFAVLKTPQLRQRPSNYLLLSLAVADLIVTMFVQPLLVVQILLYDTSNPYAQHVLNRIYLFTMALSGGSSLSHLSAISIDRALATVKPHKHPIIMKQGYKVMISLCWGTVSILFIGHLSVQIVTAGKFATLIYTSLLVTYISINFLLMIASCVIILFRIKFPKVQTTIGASHFSAREKAMEKRVSGTIAIVIFLFAVCWLPVVAYRLANPDTSEHNSFDVSETLWIRTLYLANSSTNFTIYSLRIRQFRAAYSRIMTRMIQPCRKIALQRNANTVHNITMLAPLSINTSNLSTEIQDTSKTNQI